MGFTLRRTLCTLTPHPGVEADMKKPTAAARAGLQADAPRVIMLLSTALRVRKGGGDVQEQLAGASVPADEMEALTAYMAAHTIDLRGADDERGDPLEPLVFWGALSPSVLYREWGAFLVHITAHDGGLDSLPGQE